MSQTVDGALGNLTIVNEDITKEFIEEALRRAAESGRTAIERVVFSGLKETNVAKNYLKQRIATLDPEEFPFKQIIFEYLENQVIYHNFQTDQGDEIDSVQYYLNQKIERKTERRAAQSMQVRKKRFAWISKCAMAGNCKIYITDEMMRQG